MLELAAFSHPSTLPDTNAWAFTLWRPKLLPEILEKAASQTV